MKEIPLLISYQSFNATEPGEEVYFPYLLKEYRNRWFLICRSKRRSELLTLALDRIIEFEEMPVKNFSRYQGVDFERYYSDTIGVTKSERDRARKVILWIDQKNAQYVTTKPLHSSQAILKQDKSGTIIRLDVVLNFELEREILGFGESMKVLAPRALQTKLKQRLAKAAARYHSESIEF